MRTRAVWGLPRKTTIEDLKRSGKPWAPTGVLTEKVIVPRADSDTALKDMDDPLTFAPEVNVSLLDPSCSDLGTQRHAPSIVYCARVSMPRRQCTSESVVNDGSVQFRMTQLSNRNLNDVVERKTTHLAEELERSVNRASSETERQFCTRSQRLAATSPSDPFDLPVMRNLQRFFGRGQKRTLIEDYSGCT